MNGGFVVMKCVAIRPYEPADRDTVRRLAADTAFFGEPVERYLDDRRLFCDALYAYYTDHEPQHGWVACADDEVVGFLMGCVDTALQRRVWIRRILPRLALGLLTGKYRTGRLTWRHARRLARMVPRAGPRVNLAKYPAHLHLNIHAQWRRHGLGRRLLEAFLHQLRERGTPGVHLNTTNLNSAAGRLFESAGFQVLNTRVAPQWSGLAPGDVFSVSYVLDLQGQAPSRDSTLLEGARRGFIGRLR
jgi:ribosomal protein S18 acetylase RimI-like enzyme